MTTEPNAQEDAFFEVDSDAETEDDLESSSPEASSTAVVTGTDWTAETILRQLDRGNIELNPRFQRRETWTDPRKSAFIESLILGLPIPQLVLAERPDKRGSYLVIDGKQRLIALRRFAADIGQEDFAPLRLRKLEVRSDLEGMTLTDMRDSPDLFEDVSAFENQTIRTVVVRAWPDENFLFRVFLRLNTGSVPLSPQELRQALHPGPFIDFADDWSANSPAIRAALKLNKPDFRMRDVELLIRYFGFLYFLDEYNGNLKHFLDVTCLSLNDRWGEGQGEIIEAAAACDEAIEATRRIFGKASFRRFSADGVEGRFNRAVFDVMTFYFREESVRLEAEKHSSEVVETFKSLCTENPRFIEAITATTKSIPATFSRLELWGSALAGVLEIDLKVPSLEGNRFRL
jgi:hypothetical protein